jgi:adenylate cyclase
MKRLRRLARRFGLGRAIGLVLLIAFVALRYWDPIAVEELRLRSFDFYQVIKPREAKFRPVVIVDIDEASLKQYGQWPWPRTLIAQLVDRLTAYGVAGVGFDVLFAEPDRTSPAVVAKAYPGLDEATRDKLVALPSNDDVLAAAMRRSRVVLGQSGEGAPQPNQQALGLTGFVTLGADPKPYLITFPTLLRNISVLEQAAAGNGLFSFRPDRDGIVRRAPLAMSAAGNLVPSLSTEVLRVAFGQVSPVVRTDEGGIFRIGVPGYELPTDGNGRVWVYYGLSDKKRYVSAKDVLEGTVPPDRLAQRVILVGTSAIGLLDLKTTPVDGAMPGVEVHAQVLETALQRRLVPPTDPRYEPVSFLYRPYWTHLLEMSVVFAVGIAIIALAPLINALVLLIVGGVGVGAMIFASWFTFTHQGLLIDATFPLMSSLAIYIALVFVNYFREQLDRQYIRSTFSQYLSPTVVAQIAKSREKLALGGQSRTMTIMFSDVRGFTTIAELYKDDPEGLTNLMNRLLTPVSNAILARQGTIDKYMGDAVMAFWNAPLDDPDHAVNACEAALDMLDRVDELNRERELEAKAHGQTFLPMNVGIGLNSGRTVVGNMGSDMRMQYTVMGDTVNVASRLEGQTKSYGVRILVGSRTAEALKDRYAVLELDSIAVKGKTEPEVVYTVLGRADLAQSNEFRALRAAVAAVLAKYRAQDWKGALAALAACRGGEERFAFDDFAELFADRIELFEQNPPGPEWNGVFALETK